MKDIAIYGAGGLGREVAAILINNLYFEEEYRQFVGFFDDGIPIGTSVDRFGKVIGGIKEINNWDSPLDIVLCFGDGNTTYKVFSKITNKLINFPNLINKDLFLSDPNLTLGKGNIINGGCAFTTNIKIGDFNLFNGGIVLGHDVKVGSFNTFMPGCRISGDVKIGDYCQFGSMSFVKQRLRIGNNVKLSPLSPLLTNPKDNNLYIGNPAKLFKF